MALLATIVHTDELLLTVAASFVAGVGVPLVFSVAIWGAARSVDLSHDERPVAATAAAVVGLAALVVTLAAVVVALIVMTEK